MKKLLSICFLSILLGLLSFSVSAQQGGNCGGGFWIENLQPDIVDQVANGGTAGQIALTHTLGSALRTDYGTYVGNAEYNKVEYYKLHLCSADICGDKKVSIDWELYWQNPETGVFERVNDNLSDYAEFSIYTLYKELTNTSGVHDFVRWLGGQVPDGNGFCNPMAQPGQYQFHPETATTPTNYPGALQAQYGCPECVLTIPGEEASAQGLTPLYTEALDYFYMAFLKQAETYVQIKWKNLGNYYLVMSIRERHDGTDWPNLHYDRDEHKYVGGHMSVCGDILYSDTIGFPVFDTLRQQVCEGSDPLVLGRPDAFTFDRTIPDTNIILGTNMLVGTDCAYLDIDTMLHVSYIVRHTPAITGSDKEICACTPIDASLFNLQKDKKDLANAIDTIIEWKNKNGIWSETFAYNNKSYERETPTNFESSDTVYTYIVRQRNVYEYYGEIDTCDGPAYTLTLTVKSLKIPTLVMDKDAICREEVDENTQLTITSTPGECGSSTLWFSNYNFRKTSSIKTISDYLAQYPYDTWTSKLDTNSQIVFNSTDQNVLKVNLIDYLPKNNVNKDTTIYFFAVTVNTDVDGCESKHFAWVPFTIHMTPEIAVTQPKAINCPATVVDLKATITNNPKPEFTYYWGGDVDNAVSETTKTVGTGSYTKNLPINAEANYSYTQQIFTPAQVGAKGNITKLAFQYSKSGSYNLNQKDVKIYLTTSDNATFANKNWLPVTEDELVYNGALKATASGWIELPLAKEYAYDSTKNLVVVVEDLTSADKVSYGTFLSSSASSNVTLRYAGSNNYNGNPSAIPTSGNTITRDSYRSNIKFTVMPFVSSTTDKTVTEHFTIPTTARCNDAYVSTVYVKDANGCKSVVDTFRFKVGVEHAPTISNVPTAPVIVYACKLDNTNTSANNTPAYETIADLVGAGMTITDDCGLNYLTLTHTDAAILRGDCRDTLVRTYTIHNLCDSTVSFTQTFYGIDTTRPYFIDTLTNTVPYIRMLPVRAANCTYNAPTREALVQAIQSYVFDNCTEMTYDYLIDHSEFYWENSEQFDSVKVVGSTDIFRANVGNQLTVRTIVWDKCGNEANAVILYFNRPDSMIVESPSVMTDLGQRPGICDDETFTLTFDSTTVKFPRDFTPKSPLTFEWENLENDVVFSNANGVETVVTPNQGDKPYHFRMHVTDAFGCDAYSELVTVYVKASPVIAIIPDIRNGAEFPLCPTYGVLTIEAVDSVTHTKVPNLDYTWSGESVNVWGSLTDTSSIYIIPDRCSETYVARVDVVEKTYGCDAYATISVPVIDTVGPVYSGDVINDTVAVLDHCVMKVPDFIHYLNNSNLIDNCQPFSTFTLRQDPTAGTEITADTMVTVYVKTKCDNKEYPIKNMFFARVPENTIAVTVDAAPASGCSPTTFDITSQVVNNIGTVTYTWKKNGTAINTNTANIQETNAVAAGQDSTDYVYSLVVKDSKECKAEASVSVRVYMTPTTIDSTSQPNTHCTAPWDGMFILNNAPVNTEYELVMDADPAVTYYKKSEVPATDPHVTATTVIFDFLPEGHGTLTVTSPKGCQNTYNINIRGNRAPVTIANTEYTLNDPTTCKNNDGSIVLHPVAGYTYEITDEQGNLLDSYVNLTNGTYNIKKISNSTFCESALLPVTLNPSGATLDFYVSATPNNSCDTEHPNGKLTFLTNPQSVYYTITLNGQEVITNIHGNPVVENLAVATYKVYAADSISGCATSKDVEVKDNTKKPTFNVTLTPNNYCANEDNLVNGSLKVTNVTTGAKVTYAYLGTNENPIPEDEVVYVNYPAFGYPQELAAGNYRVKALIESTGCMTQKDTAIENRYYTPQLNRTTKTANTICDSTIADFDGSATIYIKNTPTSDYNNIQPYKIVFDGDTSAAISGNSKTYQHLNAGTYHFSFISKYFCPSGDYTVTVDQYEYPRLAMKATPNTMCVPTFEHPGNGTIQMKSPYQSTSKYDYSFYYANENDSAGALLQVNYFNMDNYTMYHLTDTLYYVLVYDKTKGCNVHDTITVPHSDDYIDGIATPTANKNCKAPYDGTVTVTANAKHAGGAPNVDAVLMYSLVGVNDNSVYPYQRNNVFTGVKDGTYTVMVKDTTTGCAFAVATNVVVDKTENDFVINTVVSNNHSCEETYFDGALTATATSTLFTNTDFRYSLDVDDNYSETNTWTGLAGAHTVYVIDEISGCKRSQPVNVPTDNICAPIVTITPANNNNYDRHFGFCVNTENATLTADATANASCAQGDYEFMWVKDCHHDTVYGRTINVATDVVMCCDYKLHVKSLATGCTTDTIVRVCIQNRVMPDIISDLAHPIINNTAQACQNDSVMLGVANADQFSKIIWSHSHTTPAGMDKESSFKFYAADFQTELMHTFCVDVEDLLGCTSRAQVNFVAHDTVAVTIYDTACSRHNRWNRVNNGDEPIVLPEEIVRVNNATPYGCDSVYHYFHVILPEAKADFTKAIAMANGKTFCAPTDTLKSIFDSVKVKVGTLYLLKWDNSQYSVVDPTQPINTLGAGLYSLEVVNGICDTVGASFYINVDTVPVIDSVRVSNLYCASQNAEFNVWASEFSKAGNNPLDNISNTYAKMYFADDEAHTFGTPQKVMGKNHHLTFNYVTRLADTIHKKVVTMVYNDCGFVTDTANFVVDSTYIRLTENPAICEGDSLNFAAIIGNQITHFTNVRAYIGGNQYTRRSGVALSANNSKLYFMADSYCGTVTSDTVVLTVNPKPVLTVDPNDVYDLCLAGAADSIARCVTVQYADTTSWLYLVPANETLWTEAFNSEIPSTWKKYKNGAGDGWKYWNHYANSGASSMSSPVTVDNWLFTPAIDVQGNMQLNYNAWRGGNNYNGFYSVYVLRADTVPSSATAIFEENAPLNSTARSIDLSSYDGQQVYVAFRHHGTAYTVTMSLDNVSLKRTGHLVPVKNVAALVDSIKKMPQADVYYYAGNGCQELTKKVGTFRILNKVDVTAASEITVCPNEKFVNPVTLLNARIIDSANYRANELELKYYGLREGSYHELSINDKIATAAAGGKIMVVAAITGNVPNCGQDTAYVNLTIKTNDTVHPVMKPACPNSTLDQFMVANKEPKWNGTAAVTEQFWTVRMPNQTDSIVPDATAFVPVAIDAQNGTTYGRYTWITECNDTIVTPNFDIKIYRMPTVNAYAQPNDTLYICNNEEFVLADRVQSTALATDDYKHVLFTVTDPDNIVTDTVWTLGGDTIKNGKIMVNLAKYNGKTLVANVNTPCGTYYDSVFVMVDSVLPPVATGDDYICLEGAVNLTVVAPNTTSTYQWFVIDGTNDVEVSTDAYLSYTTTMVFDTVETKADSMFINGKSVTRAADDMYYFYVVETSEHGCKSTAMNNVSVNRFPASDVITVKATNIPQFVFTYQGVETHNIPELYTDSVTNYTWRINGDCPNDDLRLFVKYYIYRDGVLIPNAQIGDFFDASTVQTGSTMHSHRWINSNTVSWISTTNQNVHRTTYHYSTTPDGTTADDFMNGNMYPSANLLGQGAAANHDWWYLHFFNNRPIDATLVPFRQHGEYKIVYELWSTSNDNITQFQYRDSVNSPIKIIGGDNGAVGQYVELNLIVTDSLIFSVVNGVSEVPSAQPVVEPSVAPALVVETVAPEMEVWPNPAPAITTTLKARVHHMAGEANVVLTNLSGKQIYNGNMNIDSDNYYFEVGVNNLSVGTYIMTVRTQDAVITKKVVVTSLAR